MLYLLHPCALIGLSHLPAVSLFSCSFIAYWLLVVEFIFRVLFFLQRFLLWLSTVIKYFVVQSAGSSSVDLEEIYFDFRKQCFVYSKEKGTFYKLSYPTKETFGHYLKCSGHGSEAKVLAATEKWGRNVWVSFYFDHYRHYFHIHLLHFSTRLWWNIVFAIEILCSYNIYELETF